VVGVNRYAEPAQTAAEAIPTLKIDPEGERRQVARVTALRARRDGGAAAAALGAVRDACAGDANIMEAVLGAVRKQVTLGEICQVFRDVFGEYRDPAQI